METYIVNGKEIQYDTFDLANLELFDSEVHRVGREIKALGNQKLDENNYLRVLREQANSILDFFDTVIGEGASKEIFGGRINIRDIAAAYRTFTEEVTKAMRNVGSVSPAPVAETTEPINREQRRAAERERRREEARRKATEKAAVKDEA